MAAPDVLKRKIDSADGRDYGAYQTLLGSYEFPGFRLFIDQIPKDPYAPSHTGLYRVVLPNGFTSLKGVVFHSKVSETAFCDFLARAFHRTALSESGGRRGTGNSGLITIEKPGQSILRRNSILVSEASVEARFFMGLPAQGRSVLADICRLMFFQELPAIIMASLMAGNSEDDRITEHIQTAEDAEYIRAGLDTLNLAAFIADGSILPRKSGTSDEPLAVEKAVPFVSPESLAVEMELPRRGRIRGMGIPKGITLIAGGGYHGKSTLLNAVSGGICNHIPGDGREKCICDARAVKIRAYNGRYVENVDISPFIDNLPFGKDTSRFSTENASGSTSQAAGIMESVEAGARVLLMDEDTCAANFMIRDRKMQQLVRKEDEPIITFIDRIKAMYSSRGISTILVSGGMGDYFGVSDFIIQMKNYTPLDVTARAHEISISSAEKRLPEGEGNEITAGSRVPAGGCIDPFNEYGKKSVYSTEIQRIRFGKNIIDLTDVEQLVELAQVKAIAAAILRANEFIDGKRSLMEIISELMSGIEKEGLDFLSPKASGNLDWFRDIDIAFALNRLRGLKILK